MKSLSISSAASVALLIANMVFGLPAAAAACGPDALGTSRTITLERAYGAWGKAQHDALPLKNGEVVLTFDDGPNPETTPLVLRALADQCIKATFFMVGDNMARFPEVARSVARAGHSTGMHSLKHRHPDTLTPDEQLADLKQTQDIYQATFGTAAPAYRFPFLEETPTLMSALKAQKVAVMSVDLGIGDWEDVSTGILAARLRENLKATGGGIILMHDAYQPLAKALPILLKMLKQDGYTVVHVQWRK